MPNDTMLDDLETISRRSLVMFIIVDVSGSMKGKKIGAVQIALEELLPELAQVGEADAEIKIAVLTFADDCRWLTPMPMLPNEFELKPFTVGGVTNFGDACRELGRRMSSKDLLQSPSHSFAPILILMSDGEPTDQDYMKGVEELKKNNWYKMASKFAIPIGGAVDLGALAAFTGTEEAVLDPATHSADLIQKIRKVAMESAAFATRSLPEEGGVVKTRQEMVIDSLHVAQEDWKSQPPVAVDDLGVDLDDPNDIVW